MGAPHGSLVLSALEFDMLWEVERLPERHPALDVLSPGVTHSERAALVERAWRSLADRGLARGRKASAEVVDMLNLFAHPLVGIDVWVWADREIRGLAVSVGREALLGVVDGDEVWLIPARDSALPEAAVSVAGELPAGVGQSVSVPYGVLRAADAEARGDAKALVTALEDRGVVLWQAQELAGMLVGMVARGQVGVERQPRSGQTRRAERVVAFHDTDAGRYLFAVERSPDGDEWATITPADNHLLAQRVWELLDER
ncbi:EspG family protein [Amycolatopsis arida]|uniref:EspG family protein n=1 Tax=Amycolatopsis arida TaxID=587909 RepID=A0A1I5T2I0_9PSEU|nr:ESX secretion-associated protein EspG [Amycolatopsis arida]TDX96254.1 ESAT-6 protein secretion system EspG family protein [Amycolatopsis arida]SFP77242.1 EspG family protein [Amycolatopsis arida]